MTPVAKFKESKGQGSHPHPVMVCGEPLVVNYERGSRSCTVRLLVQVLELNSIRGGCLRNGNLAAGLAGARRVDDGTRVRGAVQAQRSADAGEVASIVAVNDEAGENVASDGHEHVVLG